MEPVVEEKGTIMATRKIWSSVGRMVVIASLALALVVGTVAVSHPSDVSAMPKLTCAQATTLGNIWWSYGDLMAAYGYWVEATAAYAKAEGYYDICNSWA